MGIAEEIFGFTKIDNCNCLICATIDTINQWEISEEAIAEIIYQEDCAWHEDYTNASRIDRNKYLAAAIKANANKIFVRRGK